MKSHSHSTLRNWGQTFVRPLSWRISKLNPWANSLFSGNRVCYSFPGELFVLPLLYFISLSRALSMVSLNLDWMWEVYVGTSICHLCCGCDDHCTTSQKFFTEQPNGLIRHIWHFTVVTSLWSPYPQIACFGILQCWYKILTFVKIPLCIHTVFLFFQANCFVIFFLFLQESVCVLPLSMQISLVWLVVVIVVTWSCLSGRFLCLLTISTEVCIENSSVIHYKYKVTKSS